jgi:hypothetical protein
MQVSDVLFSNFTGTLRPGSTLTTLLDCSRMLPCHGIKLEHIDIKVTPKIEVKGGRGLPLCGFTSSGENSPGFCT